MDEARLRPGQQAAFEESLVEILQVGASSTVLVRNVATGVTSSVAAGALSSIARDAPSNSIDIATHDADELARACHWRDAMEKLESQGSTAVLVEEVAKELNCSCRTVRRHLREHRRNAGLGAHIRKPSGPPPGSCLLAPAVENIIDECIKSLWLDEQQRDMAAICTEVAMRCQTLKLPPPADSSIRRRINMVDARLAVSRRRGKKVARDRFDPASTPFHVERALDLLQMDHALVDVILVDTEHRAPIGRPWLTLGIDCATRVVGGIYLSLEYPSSVSVASCVTHAFLPKERWLKSRAIDATWPVHGRWKTLHTDNAREFCSDALRAGCSAHQIILEYRPVKTPHYGAHIERLIGTLSRKIKLLSGATFSSIEKRGTYDSDQRATLTLLEFERWLIHEIEIYHNTPHRGLGGATPSQAWAGSLEKYGIAALPPSLADQRKMFLDFLPFKKRVVSRNGIALFTGRYWAGVLSPFIAPKEKVVVRYDPRNMSCVFVRSPEGAYIDVPYSDVRLPSASLGEIKRAAKELRRRNHDPRDEIRRTQIIKEQRVIEKEAAIRSKRARRAVENRSVSKSRDKEAGFPKIADAPVKDDEMPMVSAARLQVEEWY